MTELFVGTPKKSFLTVYDTYILYSYYSYPSKRIANNCAQRPQFYFINGFGLSHFIHEARHVINVKYKIICRLLASTWSILCNIASVVKNMSATRTQFYKFLLRVHNIIFPNA